GRPERGGGWRLRVPRARRRQQGSVPGRHPLPGQPVQEEGPLQGEGRAADLRDAEGARGRAAQPPLTAADRDRNGAFGPRVRCGRVGPAHVPAVAEAESRSRLTDPRRLSWVKLGSFPTRGYPWTRLRRPARRMPALPCRPPTTMRDCTPRSVTCVTSWLARLSG